MRIALDRRTVAAAGIFLDVAVLAFIVWIRWQAQHTAVPDPSVPGVAELPQWWWKVGWLGDWVLYPGADAGLWAINVDLFIDGGPLDLHRPPLFTILTGLVTHLIGDVVFSGHMVNHGLSLLVCVAIYAFGRSTSGRGAAMGAAVLTAMSTELILSGAEFGVDASLQSSMMVLALVSWLAANGSWWRVVPAGIVMGLAAGAHFISFAFVLPAVLLLLLADETDFRWRRRLLHVVVALTLTFLVWKLLMLRYPPASVPQILRLYGEAVHTYNPGATERAGVSVFQAVTLMTSQFLGSPTEALARALQPFASLSIPAFVLLPLCLLGLAGPGLRQWHSLRINLVRQSNATKWQKSAQGWQWRPGLGVRVRRDLGWDWRPCLWLLLFLAPMAVAAAANAPNRYTLYCMPMLYLAATRGIASIAAGFDRLLCRGVSQWPRGITAFVACLGLIALAWPSRNLDAAKHRNMDEGVLQRVVGERIAEKYGGGGCLVTTTPEICYFADGWTCPSSLCSSPDDHALRRCLQRFLSQTPRCPGDLAFVVEPNKDQGPFLDPNETMNDFITHRFEVDETLVMGEQTTILYRLERDVLREIASGGAVWPQQPGGTGEPEAWR